MKSFKLGILTVASMFALNSFAQVEIEPVEQKIENRQIMTPEQKAEKQTARLDEKLSLSEDQKNKAFEINLHVNNKNKAVRDDANATKEFKISALKGNNEIRENLIRELLTEEQKKKLDAMKAKKSDRKSSQKHDHSDPNHKH